MIASLVEPVTYDRLATLRLYLWAGGLVLAGFLVICAACILQGCCRRRKHKLHRPAEHIGKENHL